MIKNHQLYKACISSVLLAAVFLLFGTTASLAYAEVTRFVIESRESPAFEGRVFAEVGQYEKLTGRAFGELDPDAGLNSTINDLQYAPRNANGKVEYFATFTLLKPIDMNRGSGVLLYSVPNRGNHLLASTFHRDGDPGDGFIYQRGHCVLYSGWQGDCRHTQITRCGFGITHGGDVHHLAHTALLNGCHRQCSDGWRIVGSLTKRCGKAK